MSYDLYITPRQFDPRAIRDWFAARRHYEVGELQVVYGNEDTGVYFSFDFEVEPEQEEGEPQPCVAFNLNFVRPHTFALEAEPEVAAFLAAFDSTISDGQIDGMAEGPYSRDGFLRGWNAGNRYAFMAVGARSDSPPWPADPAIVEAIWQWNYDRADLQRLAGEDIFLARITWFLASGAQAPVPACVWTEGVPTMIPEFAVSHVLLAREPRRGLMARLGLVHSEANSSIEIALTDISGVATSPSIDRREVRGQMVLLTPPGHPTDVQRHSSTIRRSSGVNAVPADQICGADLVALMKKPA